MSQSLFIDIDCYQQKKSGQNACGDSFFSKRFTAEGRLIAVLSDGLGSGIKANILSEMTGTMLLKFVEDGKNIIKSCEIVMDSLPVCQVRKISYATFSVIDCNEEGHAKIIEEGNPEFIWIRDNKIMQPETTIITSKTHSNRHMHLYDIKLQQEDRLIFCSDGVTQTGLGSKELRLGLRREGLIEYVLDKLKNNPKISSRELSQMIVHMAQAKEVDRKAKDDISACVLYLRQPRKLMVFTGPPYYQERDKEYCEIFINFPGKKAICGGTTANVVSRELNISIESTMKTIGKLPASSKMEGIDLVTEGILTLTQALDYLENPQNGENKKDAAKELTNILLDNDCIEFMVGAKLNQAHYDPDLPVELEIRKNVVKRMIGVLQDKYMKKVNVQFI